MNLLPFLNVCVFSGSFILSRSDLNFWSFPSSEMDINILCSPIGSIYQPMGCGLSNDDTALLVVSSLRCDSFGKLELGTSLAIKYSRSVKYLNLESLSFPQKFFDGFVWFSTFF